MKKRKESVSCIIFDEQREKVLLIKRRDIPVWVLPGGGIEIGETPEKAAIRETNEETGLCVKIQRKVALYRKANWFTRDTHYFECIPYSGKLSTSSETKEIAFFALSALPKKLVPFYKVWIEDALKDQHMILEKTIEKTSYLTVLKYLICHPFLVFRFLLTQVGIHLNS